MAVKQDRPTSLGELYTYYFLKDLFLLELIPFQVLYDLSLSINMRWR